MKTLFFLCLLISRAFAISETNYSDEFNRKVIPHFSALEKGTLINAQKMTLHYHYSLKKNATKTLVILPGRTEPALKYAEVIYDLDREDLNIFILDHQGQGESDRLLSDSNKGHVRSYQDYVSDLDLWINDVVLPGTRGTEHLLLAHSMGGTIATLYLAKKNPFSKIALNAPMLEIDTRPYKPVIAHLLADLLEGLGRGNKYAPGWGPYVPEKDTFEKGRFTHSRARFDMTKSIWLARPELVINGPTVRWVYESFKATKNIANIGRKIDVPLLVFQAGQDQIVKPAAQNTFCALAKNCRIEVFPDAYHEILMEKDADRDRALRLIKSHLGI